MVDETRCLCSNHDLESLVADITRTGKLTMDQTCFVNRDVPGAIDATIYVQPALWVRASNETSSPFSAILTSLRQLTRQFHPLKDEPLMILFE